MTTRNLSELVFTDQIHVCFEDFEQKEFRGRDADYERTVECHLAVNR